MALRSRCKHTGLDLEPKRPAGRPKHNFRGRRHKSLSPPPDQRARARSSSHFSDATQERNNTLDVAPKWKNIRNVEIHQVSINDAAAMIGVCIEGPGASSARRHRLLRINAEALARLSARADFQELDASSTFAGSSEMSDTPGHLSSDMCLEAIFNGLQTWICCKPGAIENAFHVSIYACFGGGRLHKMLESARDFKCSWRLCDHTDRKLPEPSLPGINNVEVDGVGEAATPEDFRLNLMPHQRRGLSWMLRREKFGLDELCVSDSRRDKPICEGLDLRLEVRLENTFFLRGGLLCDVVGSGKTATMLALVLVNSTHSYVPKKFRSGGYDQTLTKATLVLCPANVQHQWLTEAQKFCPDKFRAISLQTTADLQDAKVAELVEADIVVAPYDLFARDVEGVCVRLERMSWHRVVLDEFHELCSKKTTTDAVRNDQILAALRSMEINKRWGISGTPESFLNSHASIVRASSFFLCDLTARSATTFVEHFCRQARICIPVEVHQHVIRVRQSPNEQVLYLDQLARTGFPQNFVWTDVDNSIKRSKDQTQLRKLLQLCSHFTTNALGDRQTATQACEQMLEGKCNDIRRAMRAMEEFISSNEVLRFSKNTRELLETKNKQEHIDEMTSEHEDLRKAFETKERENLLNACEALPTTYHRLRETFVEDEHFLEAILGLLDACREVKGFLKIFVELREPTQSSEDVFEYIYELEDYCNHVLAAYRKFAFFKRNLSLTQQAPGGVTCPICLEEDVDASSAYILLCGHVLCSLCARHPSLKKCPQCRMIIPQLSGYSVQIGLAFPQGSDHKETSERDHWGCKLLNLVETMERIQQQEPGGKILVFTQWEALRTQASQVLTDIGVRHLFLSGDVIERTRVLNEFRSDCNIQLLLLSLEDSASGTNLTVASHVFLMHPMLASSPEEVASYEAQAIGRVVRMGQMRPVHIWRFVTSNTVEERLWRLCKNDVEVNESR